MVDFGGHPAAAASSDPMALAKLELRIDS